MRPFDEELPLSLLQKWIIPSHQMNPQAFQQELDMIESEK